MAWEVRITGDESDLRMLAEAFDGPECAIVERGLEFFLGGTSFDHLGDARAVRDSAREFLASVSGASRLFLSSSKPIHADQVAQFGDDGRQHLTIFPESVAVHARIPPVTVLVAATDGTVERHLPADPIVEAVGKAIKSEAVRRVLRLRNSSELQLRDLTNILEVIQADGGPVNASRDELSRLTGSANHPDVAGDLARHGAPSWDPPPNRMTLSDGRALIDRIIRNWLAAK